MNQVNQQTFLDGSESQKFYGAIVISHDAEDKTITVRFPTGWSIRVGLGSKMLDISVNAASQYKEQAFGLLGFFNGDMQDDLMQPPITNLTIDASLQQIHEEFGQLCKIYW